MSPDLVAIGDHLEDATKRALARRRARRQTAMNAAATFIIALPIAIAAATADLTPPEPAGIGDGPSTRSVLEWGADYPVAGSHLPAARGPRVIATVRCPERRDCPPPQPVPPTLKRALR